MNLTIEAYIDGHWETAASVIIANDDAGHRSGTKTLYDADYWFAVNDIERKPEFDDRAITVALPFDIDMALRPTWPSFLLDMLPQGPARRAFAVEMRLDLNSDAVELPLLLRSGGAPIGNLRIRQAYDAERARVQGFNPPSLTVEDIENRSEPFVETVARYALLATGSTGVQGEWPKIMLTKSRRDDAFYPDSVLDDADAFGHVIVKTLPNDQNTAAAAASTLILQAEPGYLEVARAFGLRCGAPLRYVSGSLIIPRFDREVADGRVVRHGQESLVSASGISAFGHQTTHERYLDVIKRVTSHPETELVEYVLREMLATVMGDSDNHGRNTALQKKRNLVQLTPVFDFAPMRLDPRGIARSTRWGCETAHPPRPADMRAICGAATDGTSMSAEALLATLKGLAPRYREAKTIAREAGVPEEVVERAILNADTVANAIEAA